MSARTSVVERDWTTAAGYRAVVLLTPMGHRCGYVALPTDHPLHGCGYGDAHDSLTFPAGEPIGKRGIIPLLCCQGEARPDVVFDVHGSITFAGNGDGTFPVEHDGQWWFGYDCAHADDEEADLTTDYCVGECESLAQQLIDRVCGAKAPA